MFSDILAVSCVMAFLPPQLLHAGYSSWTISVVIGMYFVMGWAANSCLTVLQLSRLFNGTMPEPSWQLVHRQVLFIILAVIAVVASLALQAFGSSPLGLGAIGLSVVHSIARSVQGSAGATIYYYAFLVVPTAFEDHQKTYVLTAMSLLPGLAQLFGPFIGAALYTHFGAQMTFVVLSSAPAIATILLFRMYMLLPVDDKDEPEGQAIVQPNVQDSQASSEETQTTGWGTLPKLFADSAFIRALVCCCPPDVLKNAFALMLPLFATSQGYSDFQIGLLPLISGSGLIIFTCCLGFFWTDLSPRGRRVLGTSLLVSLGIVAQIMFRSYFFDQSRNSWYIALFVFGALSAAGNLGTYHISEFADKQMYPAAFGVWNSLWLLSGCLGTFRAGHAKADDWEQQQAVLMVLGIVSICAGALLALVD
eukprot:gnl/MRDRNA2_/MRDRNA2_35069_c0_seq1.p1 gnl/MRDRNA2_/MRDRNA2_35069_c0~~gnl/MRDRNA2_/MRDRNA2_35069_c0_seq1.p1  ORF type:complete len:475 (+),score=57.77 gnl/MRDRNA2_/MRDRNA2_35069_c0_seq1:163-1425(+)